MTFSPGADRSEHLDGRAIDVLGVLHHHDGIGAVRQHPTGRDGDGLTQVRATLGRVAHQHFADDVQIGW